MGYNTYTTADLVYNIGIVGHIPDAQNTFTADKLITLADRELKLSIMKQILSTRGGYYLTYEDFEAQQDGLYVIPGNATAGSLANVELIQGTTIVPVNLIEESEQFATDSPTSTSYGFFMRGNYVQILPTPPIGFTRLWYFRRPSKLVPITVCAKITAVTGAVISVASVPSNIVVGAAIDVCGDQPPFNILGERIITDITGTDITLDLEVETASIGDWIALRDQTCVPAIPVEYRVLLEQRVVCKIYEIQGYLDKLTKAKEILRELEQDTFSLITPRVKSQTKVIAPVNGGFLSGNRNRMTNFPAGRE